MEPDGIANPQPAAAEAGRPVPLSRVFFCKMLIFTLLLYNSGQNPRFSGLLLYNGKQNPRFSGLLLYNGKQNPRVSGSPLYRSGQNPCFSGLLLYSGKQNPRSSGSPLYNIMKKKRLCLLPFYIFVVILRLSKETSFFEITNRMSNNKM